eukprot:m.85191 g.85191  ORF g.85191 m.85191 type:complete len:600 (-) comp13000_c0_seq2:48-1847(-)
MLYLFVLVACLTTAAAMQLHVCPSELRESGDKNPYFESLDQALAAVSASRATAMHSEAVDIEMCGGIHQVTTTAVLKEEHSSVHIHGSTGATATVLSSGYHIKGWTKSNVLNGAVYEATLPPDTTASRQMWVNQRRAARAQCSGTAIQGKITDEGYSNVTATSTAPKAPMLEWLGTGVEFVFHPSGASWTEPRCSVNETFGTTSMVNVVMMQPCFYVARNKHGNQEVAMPYTIENALALLDEPGEWFADFNKNMVYYYPLPGEDMSTVDAVLGTEPSLEAVIVAETNTRDISISSMTYMYQTWLNPSSPEGFVDLQSGFWFQGSLNSALHGVPGVLSFHGSHNISIDNCTFTHIGLTAVLADYGSQGVRVTNSIFSDLSGSSVTLGNVTVPIMTPDNQDGGHTVMNNHIRDTGAEYRGCAGIMAGYVANTEIMHNDIANTSNGAICIGWGWGAKNSMQQNKVNYNRIIRSNTELKDCGSIYTLSAQPNSEVAYNYISNQVLLYGSLYHDAHSAYFHTHDNVVEGGPMWLYLQWGPLGPVSNITVDNNYHDQIVAGGCATPQHSATCPDLIVTNNTVVSGGNWPPAAQKIMSGAGIMPGY